MDSNFHPPEAVFKDDSLHHIQQQDSFLTPRSRSSPYKPFFTLLKKKIELPTKHNRAKNNIITSKSWMIKHDDNIPILAFSHTAAQNMPGCNIRNPIKSPKAD